MSNENSGLKLAGGTTLTQPYSSPPSLYSYSMYAIGFVNSSSDGRYTFISSTSEKSDSFVSEIEFFNAICSQRSSCLERL